MSYDISYRVKCKDDPKLWAEIGNWEANTTWNLGDMIRKSTGLEWKNEEDNGLVKDVIPFIIHGLEELERFPNKYKFGKLFILFILFYFNWNSRIR